MNKKRKLKKKLLKKEAEIARLQAITANLTEDIWKLIEGTDDVVEYVKTVYRFDRRLTLDMNNLWWAGDATKTSKTQGFWSHIESINNGTDETT